jgi:hypothetical protein
MGYDKDHGDLLRTLEGYVSIILASIHDMIQVRSDSDFDVKFSTV